MNLDPQETQKFGLLSSKWWDPKGPLKTLHDINATRLKFITDETPLNGKMVLDVGCGGILTESLCREGAQSYGLDADASLVQIAKLHALDQNLNIQYHEGLVEDLAQKQPASFDIITCMEMLEHVPSPISILESCASLLKPGGHLFLSTLNRNLKTFLFGIVAAEYVLNLLPKGTHTYEKCIQPAELYRWCESLGLKVKAIKGLDYNPFSGQARLAEKPGINYLMMAVKL